MSELFDCRKAFATALIELAEQDDRVVAVCNDSVGSSNLVAYRERFPSRLINVGIAEQNMVGVAAGLASSGKIPFVCAAACFLTGRATEQVKVDAGYARNNIKLCGMASGMAYGELGPTHHSIEDVAWTRAIGNMTVVVPADPAETTAMMRAIHAYDGPVFLRVSRMGVPAVHAPEQAFTIGKAVRLREGSDLTFIAMGTLVSRALEAAEELTLEGVSVRVVNMSTVRPIDRAEVIAAASETRGIVTAEEHTTYGGLGSAVAEVVVTTRPVPMRLVGVPGVFAPTGSAEWLHDHFGLNAAGIIAAARELLA
ncbi:MAG: 1-deoxy-D-xylulose-5-phosphate synthase [Caulobacteraceae bacterium]|nr:1-deoxy-D-xylulose-5-phosphate synthase [Caulobacteraceae bacterium]